MGHRAEIFGLVGKYAVVNGAAGEVYGMDIEPKSSVRLDMNDETRAKFRALYKAGCGKLNSAGQIQISTHNLIDQVSYY